MIYRARRAMTLAGRSVRPGDRLAPSLVAQLTPRTLTCLLNLKRLTVALEGEVAPLPPAAEPAPPAEVPVAPPSTAAPAEATPEPAPESPPAAARRARQRAPQRRRRQTAPAAVEET